MLESLLSLPDHTADENKRRKMTLEKELDEALDIGECIEGLFSDHTYYENTTVDPSAMRYFGGYVARRARKISHAKHARSASSA